MAERLQGETGWYRDQRGEVWHCVATATSMVCNSAEHFTSAYHATFARWGWTRVSGHEGHDYPGRQALRTSDGGKDA